MESALRMRDILKNLNSQISTGIRKNYSGGM